MAFKLSELLNPAPNSDPPSPTFYEKLSSPSQPRQQQQQQQQQPPPPHIPTLHGQPTARHSRHNSYNDYPPGGVNRYVVDAYPQMSSTAGNSRHDNCGSEPDYTPQQQNRSRGHSRTYSGSPIMTNYGPPAIPVEPALDQYHQTSHSPVTETKPWEKSPPPILAPIQIHPAISNEQPAQTTPPKQEPEFHFYTADPAPLTYPTAIKEAASNDEMEDVRYEVNGQELTVAQNTSPTPQIQQSSPPVQEKA